MASEGKEKKRKASAATTVLTDPPSKKSKKAPISDITSDLKKKTDAVANDIKKLQKLAADQKAVVTAASEAPSNDAVVKSKKSRKRAADYMEEDNQAPTKQDMSEKIVIANGENDEVLIAIKSKKSKKSKKAGKGGLQDQEEADEVTGEVEENVIVATTDKTKKQKTSQLWSVGLETLKSQDKTVPKKKASTSAFHADRIEKLLGTQPLDWDHNKRHAQRKPTKQSLTADGVNGILEQKSNANLATATASKDVRTSLQAEAQHTLDQELEDEYGSDDQETDDESIEESEDDQGAALLAGFDSDEEDPAEDKPFDPNTTAQIPDNKATKKLIKKALKKGTDGSPGTVYVGRIPHGFYEHPMRAYFSQFGTITKLRLSRNRTTGASKHFAFIEFESNEVAKIVAETMDNYLMFGHILKCKYAPQESLHPDTWKGANKRFKKVPYNKLEKKRLEAPKTEQQWEFKINKEQKKREAKAEKMKELGYDLPLPKMKAPSEALERNKLQQAEKMKAIEPATPSEDATPTGALEAPHGLPKDEVVKKLSTKDKKDKKVKKGGDDIAFKDIEDSVNADAQPSTTRVQAPVAAEPAVPHVEPVKDKNKNRNKKKPNTKEMLKSQLQAGLQGSADPLTSETTFDLPVSSNDAEIFDSAFGPEGEGGVDEAPIPMTGEAKKQKKRSKKSRTSTDGGVALPAEAPGAIVAAAKPNSEKTKKSKTFMSNGDDEGPVLPSVVPTLVSASAPQKVGKKEKKSVKRTAPEEELDNTAVTLAISSIPAAAAAEVVEKKQNKKTRKSEIQDPASSTLAPPMTTAALKTQAEKKDKVKKRKPDADGEAKKVKKL